jgi:hypothetical protein
MEPALMLMPLRNNASRQMVSTGFSVPPPVGGLNAKDALESMPPEDAVVLENFFPEPNSVRLRRGFAEHATGMSGPVFSLMEWAGPTTRKLFGATQTAIYNVSSAGAVGAADVSLLTNGKWQHTMFATAGGNFLFAVNGADSARAYDGSAWSTPAITGLASTNFIDVCPHKFRLWFVRAASTSAYYLGTNAIAGAVTEFPLGPLFTQGGRLLTIASWTRDGGSGPDDFLAFISSTGEIAVYQGTDPSSANDWALVGVYRVGPPIGQRCVLRTGADIALITKDGIVSVTRMISLDRSISARAAVTEKIAKLFSDDARSYGTNFGWQAITYPQATMTIVNVPTVEGSIQRQYAMNSLTGAWSRFTGMNASCWALFNDELYFGGNDGVVYKGDVGFQDNGEAIQGDIKTAFNYFKSRGQLKAFKMARPIFLSNGQPNYLMGLNVDFDDSTPSAAPTPGAAPVSLWGVAQGGVDVWGGGSAITKGWVGVTGIGMCAALRLRVTSNGASCVVNSFDVLTQRGGIL